MDPNTQRAVDAIADAERAVAAAGPFEITPQHWRDVAAVMALPENQDGADKSRVWRVYVLWRRHCQGVRLV